ncbi:hypothetical protein D3C84_942520 [compost metagenome]
MPAGDHHRFIIEQGMGIEQRVRFVLRADHHVQPAGQQPFAQEVVLTDHQVQGDFRCAGKQCAGQVRQQVVGHGRSAAQAYVAHDPAGKIAHFALGFSDALLQLLAAHFQQFAHRREFDPSPVTFEQAGAQ